MTVLKVGFVGIRSDRLDETVALFRDVMGVPVTRQADDLVGFRLADGSVLELYGPTNEFHAFFTTGPVVAFRVEPRRRCKSAIDFNLRYDALAAVVETSFRLLRCVMFSGRMSEMGHERRIQRTHGMSGPPPIATKWARRSSALVPGRCPPGRSQAVAETFHAHRQTV